MQCLKDKAMAISIVMNSVPRIAKLPETMLVLYKRFPWWLANRTRSPAVVVKHERSHNKVVDISDQPLTMGFVVPHQTRNIDLNANNALIGAWTEI